MKKKIFVKMLVAMCMIAPFVFTACNDNDDVEIPVPMLKGIFVCNEGDYGQNTGAISWFNFDNTEAILNIYQTVNGTPLGDVVQAFTVIDTLGIAVVNNSQKVEIVHMEDFSSLSTISELSYPRFSIPAGEDKIYISNGNGFGDDKLVVYDYEQMATVGEIIVGKGPERMVKSGNYIYVANSGGWSSDSTVSVVDITLDEVVTTIEVETMPVDVEIDAENNLWVLCKGSFDGSKTAKLYKIDGSTNQVIKIYDFGGTITSFGLNLITLNKEKNAVIYINDGIYKMSIDANALPTEKWVEGSFYGINVDPETGDVYACDDINKKVIVYNYNTGAVLKELVTNISYPNDVVFNRTDFMN